MGVIIKGKSRGGARDLAVHLGNTDKNESVRLFDVRGTLATTLRGALIEMEAVASGNPRCKKCLYSASIDPEPGEKPFTPAQWRESLDRLERGLQGLEGHQRVAVLHVKNGREHMHVVWNRVDPETMLAWHDGKNYAKHEKVARSLERDFGLRPLQGIHVDREMDSPRPERTPKQWEFQQAERHKVELRPFREAMRALKRETGTVQAFAEALEERGCVIALGRNPKEPNKRALIIVDEHGGAHSLSRTLGERAPAVKEWAKELDQSRLPNYAQAKAIVAELVRRPLPEVVPQPVHATAEQAATLDAKPREEPALAVPTPEPAPAKRRPSIYDYEAEAYRQAVALIDGAYRAAPGMVKREDEARRWMTAAAGFGERVADAPETAATHRQTEPTPLSPLQGAVRLAYRTTDSAAGFHSALQDKQFILSRITAEDVAARDRETVMAVRSSPDAWMLQTGGAQGLDEKARDAAAHSYDSWCKAKAGGRRESFQFERYVAHVQGKWTEKLVDLGGIEAVEALAARNRLEGDAALPALPRHARAGDLAAVSRAGRAVLIDRHATGDEAQVIDARFALFDRSFLPGVREAQREQTAEQRAHLARAEAVRDAIESGDPRRFQDAQREHRVVVAHQGATFYATTSRYRVELTEEQGYKAMEHINAERDSISAERLREHLTANRGVVNASATAPPPLPHIHRFDLPDMEAARRMAYGMDKQDELARTVTEAFEFTTKTQDGGLAFARLLTARGIELKRDRAERLHIVAEGREHRLDQFIPDVQQARHLPTLAPRPEAPAPEFVSRTDRDDRYAAERRRIEDEKFMREVAQTVREPVRAAQWMTEKAVTPARALAPVVSAAASGLGFIVRGVADLAAGLGRFAEQEREAKERPAPAPAAPPGPALTRVQRIRDSIARTDMTAPNETQKTTAKLNRESLDFLQNEQLRRLLEQEERGRGGR